MTDFKTIRDHVSLSDMSDQFIVRNYANNGNFHTRFYGHRQGVVFEVISDKEQQHSGQIASIQLF